jgi:hypothetical protein
MMDGLRMARPGARELQACTTASLLFHLLAVLLTAPPRQASVSLGCTSAPLPTGSPLAQEAISFGDRIHGHRNPAGPTL